MKVLLYFSFIPIVVGLIYELNGTNYKEMTKSGDWLVEFYAPWCHHCQKLVPILSKVSDYSKDIVRIGKLDATKNRELTNELMVHRYPTIFYIHENQTGVYEGERSFMGFISFMDRMSQPAYHVMNAFHDISSAMILRNENVSYILQIPCSNLVDCHPTVNEYQLLTKKYKLHMSFYILQLADSSKPFAMCKYGRVLSELEVRKLYCLEDGQAANTSAIEQFVTNNHYPLVSAFESHDFKVTAHLNKTMILAVVNDYNSDQSTNALIQAINAAAIDNLQKNPSDYIFGYFDSIKWKKFAKHHGAAAPSLLIIDHNEERHSTFSMNHLAHNEYSSYVTTVMNDLYDGRISFSKSDSPSLLEKIFHRIERYQFLTTILFILPIIFALLSFFSPNPTAKKLKKG